MANKLQVELVTAEGRVLSEEADFVGCPGSGASSACSREHIPLLTPLRTGEVLVRNDGQEQYFFVAGGFVEVLPDRVVILADVAERAEDIDEAAAEEARRAAQEALAQDPGDAEAALQLEHSIFRLRVAEIRRRHRRDHRARAERPEPLRSERAHPVVARVVLDLGQPERLQQRRHVHAEAAAQALLEAVPAADRVVLRARPRPRRCRRPPASARRRCPAASSRPAASAGVEVLDGSAGGSAAGSCRPGRRSPADRGLVAVHLVLGGAARRGQLPGILRGARARCRVVGHGATSCV